MTNRYEASKPEVGQKEKLGVPPKQTYLVFYIFVCEAISTVVVNLLGAYELSGIDPLGVIAFIVYSATLYILYLVYSYIRKGKKQINLIIYVFLVMGGIFYAPSWFKHGVFIGVGEFLTLLSFLVLLPALYLTKFKLDEWFKW